MFCRSCVFIVGLFFLASSNVYAYSCIGGELSNGFCWPTEDMGLYLRWHEYNEYYKDSGPHLAQDIEAIEGNDVYAIADGIVLHSRMNVGGYGGVGLPGGGIIIKHRNSSGNFFIVQYAHLKNLSVSAGTNVLKGQKIAEIGPYANGTVHLHFAIRFPFNDDSVDRWAGYGWTDKGFVNPMTFMDEYSPGHMFFRRVGNIDWAPASASCVNADTWRQWDGHGWVSVGRSDICHSVDISLLMDEYWQEILFGDRNLNEIAQCRAE